VATTLPIGIYEKALPSYASWHQLLAVAGEAGFDFVEMSVDETAERLARLDWSAWERHALRNAIADTGTQVITMCLSGHRKYPLGSASPQIREHSLDILRKAIDLAVDTGIRIIQIAGYYVYYELHEQDSILRYQDGLASGLEWAAKAGVMLALENVDGDDVTSISHAMSFVERFNSPWLQIYPDIVHLAEHGLDVCTELERGRGHFVGIHVKDTRPGEPRRVPFGQGIVPFVDGFRKLAEMNFAGPILLEMWNDDSLDSVRIVKEARDWVVERMVQANLYPPNRLLGDDFAKLRSSGPVKEAICRDSMSQR
jgi:L-ribulose-5-phosphate 3-epimerase